MKMKCYKALASLVSAYKTCEEEGNAEWKELHRRRIEKIESNHLPSGSGFDTGTKVDLDKSSWNKLVLHTSFHHMNEVGMYDGWTEHEIVVKPHLVFGIDVVVKGRNRNQIKEYIEESVQSALNDEVSIYGS